MSARRVRALAAWSALSAAGCGVGGGLAGATGGGGGGGSRAVPPPPPASRVFVAPGEVASNLVTIRYELTDVLAAHPAPAEDPRVRTFPEFATADDPGTWRPMTEAPVRGSEGTRALPLAAHTFVWNSIVDLGRSVGVVRIRVRSEYEDYSGIARAFRVRESSLRLDNRLAATFAAQELLPALDFDSVPAALSQDGGTLVVANFGSHFVERIDALGRIRRVIGLGVPGATVGSVTDPGVVRIDGLIGVAADGTGPIVTANNGGLYVTNPGPAPLALSIGLVAPRSIRSLGVATTACRRPSIHPSGALVFAAGQGRIDALNPSDPADPASATILLAGTAIAPGEIRTLAVPPGLSSPTQTVSGPDGEIYFDDGPTVGVLNTGAEALRVGVVDVPPGETRVVAGDGGVGFLGDGGVALGARFGGGLALAVSPSRVLFVGDPANRRVRAVNLSAGDVTVAGTTILAGDVDTVVGGGSRTAVGVRAREFDFSELGVGAVEADDAGNILVATGTGVLLVNGGLESATAYGKTAAPGRTAFVYDATGRAGIPFVSPLAVEVLAPSLVLFSDRSAIRALNLSDHDLVAGGSAVTAGSFEVIAGGAAPGFHGDGGPARSATFDGPAALAADVTSLGAFRLFVADTGNDRVRLVNLSDPRAGLGTNLFGVPVVPGNVATIAGGAPEGTPDDGDGLAPTSASLRSPQGVAVRADGIVFVADTLHHRIRAMNPQTFGSVTIGGTAVAAGTIRTVVGDGTAGFTADGPGPWRVDTPTALAVDSELLFFADAGNARIRVLNHSDHDVVCAGVLVRPDEVATICGTGVRGNAGDGGLGPDAQIDTPRGFAIERRGPGERVALYFTDGPQHVVRMLNLLADEDLSAADDEDGASTLAVPPGGVVTVAGGPNVLGFANSPAFAGDGGVPALARFAAPWGVALLRDRRDGADVRPSHVFVADSGNDRLRRFGAPR